jgi:hypothetical protein
MLARIFKPAKSAMQSGLARTKEWVLEFEPEQAKDLEPLMGWTSSTDTQGQVHLTFDTKDEAIGYAERHGIPYQVFEPKPRRASIKAYADNFKFNRKDLWTH